MKEIEQAIDGLKRMRIGMFSSKVDGDSVMPFLTKGIEALEKQIPKRPLTHWTGNEEEIICPNCKDYICFPENVDEVVEKYRTHCGCCGQAIDWSL